MDTISTPDFVGVDIMQNRTTAIRVGVICAGVLIVAGLALVVFIVASSTSTRTVINVDADKVAIHGYDTVAYFTEGKATVGSSEFEHIWQDARWHFASATNRDLFAENPDRYAPRYGGYCSMGLAIGEYSDADPEMWTIIDGQLYLNKSQPVQDVWRKSPEAYIVASELNWSKHRDDLRTNESLR
jgi:hypothetical protein